MGSDDMETPLVLTGSIPSASDVAFSDVGVGDRTVIAQALTPVFQGDTSNLPTEENSLRWTNPSSGNSGNIRKLSLDGLADTGCVNFQTTANTIAGIRLYNGTACRDLSQRVQITSLSMSEA